MTEGTESAVETASPEDEKPSPAMRRLMAVLEGSFEQCGQLERALKTRIVIEQAKGVLAERLRVTPEEAFELLRGAARSRNLTVRGLSQAVVEDSNTPPAILAQLTEKALVRTPKTTRQAT